jgi:hypothetical protein
MESLRERINWKVGVIERIILKRIFINLVYLRNNFWNYEPDSLDGRLTHHKASTPLRQHTRTERSHVLMGIWTNDCSAREAKDRTCLRTDSHRFRLKWILWEQFYAFVYCSFMKFSVAHTVQRWLVRLLNESWIRKDVEGSNCGIIWGKIPEFTWGDRGNHEEAQEK